MKCLAVTAALLGLALDAGAQTFDTDAFEAYAIDAFAAYEVPGAAVAIVKDGDVVLTKGFGVRTLGETALVDADTLFAIASNTKAFTAGLLATLVDEGALSWDDRVVDHLPGFRLHDPYATREMTVRDLLSHRSGNASGAGDLLWLRSIYTRDEIVRRLRFIEPVHGFRARYGYQNVMYIAAGELAEAAGGASWDKLLSERIFAPLAMATANTSIREREEGGNWATPHMSIRGTVQTIEPENVDNLGGAGAINASANDLSRWLLLQLGNGKLGSVRVYSEEQAREMHTPHVLLPIGDAAPELRARQPRFSTYGLGWRMTDYLGRKLVNHGGGLAGMTSLTTLVPEENLGVVVLTNQETSVQTALTYWVLDSYFGAPRTDWVKAQRTVAERRWKERIEPQLAEVETRRVESTQPTFEPGQYAGRYTDRLYGDALVEERDGGLRLRFLSSPAFNARLEHWHFDTFVARFDHHSVQDAFVTFSVGQDRSVEVMRMTPYSPTAGSTYHYDDLRFTAVDGECDAAPALSHDDALSVHFAHPRRSPVSDWVAIDCGVGGARELCLFYPPERRVVRLTASPDGDEGVPVFSPEGTRLSYSVKRDGTWRLAVFDLETGRSRELLELRSEFATSTAWSPDGARILFDMESENGDHDIYSIRADDGTGLESVVGGAGSQRFPSFSPKGSHLAYHETIDGDTDLVVVPAEGGTAVRPAESPDSEALPIWSPDGTQLAFYSNRTGNMEVFTVELQSGTVRQLTDDDAFDLFAVFSQDGRKILFESTRDREPSNFDRGADLYLIDIESGRLERLTRPSDFPACVGPFPVLGSS